MKTREIREREVTEFTNFLFWESIVSAELYNEIVKHIDIHLDEQKFEEIGYPKKYSKPLSEYKDRLLEVLKATGQLNKDDIEYCYLLTLSKKDYVVKHKGRYVKEYGLDGVSFTNDINEALILKLEDAKGMVKDSDAEIEEYKVK